MTLPLSYSRLRGSPASPRSPLRRAGPLPSSVYNNLSPSTRPCGPRSGHSTRVGDAACHKRAVPFDFAQGALSMSKGAAASRVVAREGFEPSKPLGRQIYSLLRLTASLPRRSSPAHTPGDALGCSERCRFRQDPTLSVQDLRLPAIQVPPASRFFVRVGSAGIVELAKGFEPPTG